MISLQVFLLGVMVVAPCTGYKMFQDEIPNGGMVPHPCKPNHMWYGVGHLALGGGGERNAFGMDFYRNGKKWDRCLCELDSDGDGKTNGEELGDPRCVWTPGSTPERTGSSLSHPGICEPFDDPLCQYNNNKFGDICSQEEETAPCIEDLKSEDGMMTWDVKLTETSVPADDTTYICQTFELPDASEDYHIVGYEPLIDNEYVMHHSILYGCSTHKNATKTADVCGMAETECLENIALWSVGGGGYCFDKEFGFRVGKTGTKSFVLQHHWTNPEGRRGWKDGSGLRIYMTPKLRPHDGGVLVIGQYDITIPPNRADVMVEGQCLAECTERYKEPIYISTSEIHMHYLGYKGYIYHMRNGKVINKLVMQDVFSYDSPESFTHEPAIEFLPGDEFRTVCHYKSTSRSDTTYYGQATSDEMCFGFITYYPRQEMPDFGCSQVNKTAYCSDFGYEFPGCNITGAAMRLGEQLWSMYEVCDTTGETCKPGCEDALKRLGTNSTCFHGDPLIQLKMIVRGYFQGSSKDTLAMLESCDTGKPRSEGDASPAAGTCDVGMFMSRQAFFEDMYKMCSDSVSGDTCAAECKSFLDAEPCLGNPYLGQVRDLIKQYFGNATDAYLNILSACMGEPEDAAGTCNVQTFISNQTYFEGMYEKCDDSASGEKCMDECKNFVAAEPCFQGAYLEHVRGLIKQYFGEYTDTYLNILSACVEESIEEDDPKDGECNVERFMSNEPYFGEMYTKCDDSISGEKCMDECRTFLEAEPCFQGAYLEQVRGLIKQYFGEYTDTYLNILSACYGESENEEEEHKDGACNIEQFISNEPYFEEMYTKCDPEGEKCSSECESYLVAEPCMHEPHLSSVREMIQLYFGEYTEAYTNMLDACFPRDKSAMEKPREMEPENESTDGHGLQCFWDYPKASTASGFAASVILISAAVIFGLI